MKGKQIQRGQAKVKERLFSALNNHGKKMDTENDQRSDRGEGHRLRYICTGESNAGHRVLRRD